MTEDMMTMTDALIVMIDTVMTVMEEDMIVDEVMIGMIGTIADKTMEMIILWTTGMTGLTIMHLILGIDPQDIELFPLFSNFQLNNQVRSFNKFQQVQ